MKKGKRLIATAMALLLAISMTACGGGKESAPETAKPVETAAAETESEAVTEPETAAPETEAAPGTESAAETETEAPAEENEAVDDQFTIGTNDGSVYENTFFNLRIDAEADGLLLANEEQLMQLSAFVADTMNSEDIKEALDSGKTFMDLYAYTPDLRKNINMNIQNMGAVFGVIGDIDAMVEMILPEMKGQLENAGMENVTLEKSTCTFRGEEVPCTIITAEVSGVSVYEKQVYIKEGSYVAFLTATGGSEEESQAMLDLVKKAD